MGINDIKLKWNMILWNGENCFLAWIFRENEFTDTSLITYIYVNSSLLNKGTPLQ